MSYTLITVGYNLNMYVANGWGKQYLACKIASTASENNNSGSMNSIGSAMRIYFKALEAYVNDPQERIYGIYTHVQGFGKWVMTNHTYLDIHKPFAPVSYVDTSATTALPPNDPKYRYKVYRHADGNISIKNLQYGWLDANSDAYFTCIDGNIALDNLPSTARFVAHSDIGTGPVMVANRATNYAPPYQQVLIDNWYYFHDPFYNMFLTFDASGTCVMVTTQAAAMRFQFENYTSLTDEPPAAENLYRLKTSTGKYVCIDATGPVQLRDYPGEWEIFRVLRNDFDAFGEFAFVSVAFPRAIYWNPNKQTFSNPYTSDSIRTRNQSFVFVPVYQVVTPTQGCYGSVGAPPYPPPSTSTLATAALPPPPPAEKSLSLAPPPQAASNKLVTLIRLAFVALLCVFGLLFTFLLAKRS